MATIDSIESYIDDIEGEVIHPDDEGYDQARDIWNSALAGAPDVIVQPAVSSDVQSVVDCVREEDLLLSVKGGGHDYAGNSSRDDALMVDFSELDHVEVDPDEQVVEVGPGATWREVYAVLHEHGVITPGGGSGVGVAGFTLGGGIDMFLARKYGLTVDNLRAVDLVTANGEEVRASADENPDLFWGICGSGWNFGVATSFEFDLYEFDPEVLTGRFLHPVEDIGEVLRFYRDRVADASNDFGFTASIMDLGGREDLPPEMTAQPMVDVTAVYLGPAEQGQDEIYSMRSFGEPIMHEIGTQELPAVKNRSDAIFAGEQINHWYTRAHCLDELSDGAIDVIEQYTSEFPEARKIVIPIIPLDGAVTERDPDATAFPFRDSAFDFNISVEWADPERKAGIKSWVQEFHEEMEPYSDGVYVNTLSYDEGDRVEEAYGDNYDDLAKLKAEWDSENLFRSNHNIEPDHEAVTDEETPGFGVGSALAGVGSLGYMLKRRLDGSGQEKNS